MIALTPPFAAEYGTRLTPRVATDETFTIVPARRSMRWGAAARHVHNVGNSDRRISFSISSGA